MRSRDNGKLELGWFFNAVSSNTFFIKSLFPSFLIPENLLFWPLQAWDLFYLKQSIHMTTHQGIYAEQDVLLHPHFPSLPS